MSCNDDLVTVIGAGVIGLTTAVRLSEHGRPVRVLAAAPPVETTSIAATGMVGLAFCEPMDRVPGWEAATLAELASIMHDDAAGVRTQRCLLGSRTSDARPPGFEYWPGYATAEHTELPVGFEHGFWLDMTVVDMTRYLPYLLDRLVTAGGHVDIGRVESLDDLVAGSAVVNCAGIGARELTGDLELTAEWGMHVIVDNPGVDHCFMEGPPGQNEWVAWMPHGDRILIGGVTASDRSDPGPDEDVADRLLAAAGAANEQLASATVIGYNSGLRPSRPSVRVEEELVSKGPRRIHNYGHGGLGVTLSWGCASDVASLLESTTPS